ncbi:hypothetical protein ADL26_06815 [Thermoactinomyces vulgaris]|nr:hypothetical protein ADL26_06815 [Thermoactinomyces vulgaris]
MEMLLGNDIYSIIIHSEPFNDDKIMTIKRFIVIKNDKSRVRFKRGGMKVTQGKLVGMVLGPAGMRKPNFGSGHG